jgi:starch synthase
MPAYRSIDRQRFGLRRPARHGAPSVVVGGRREAWTLEVATLPHSAIEVAFVGGRFFDRDGIYTDPRTGSDFEDQVGRWVFFCRAALAALAERGASPDILHLNDYHTALAAAYARIPADGFYARTATFFSIHNLGYQGLFKPQAFAVTGLPDAYMEPMGPLEFFGAMNLMKAGLVLSDGLATVSPNYAREIQESEEHGRGLQGVLRARQEDLIGILNGIDPVAWNPAADPLVAAPFDADDLRGKAVCKRDLLERAGLPHDPATPVFGSIGRLVGQKGFDLVLQALPALLPTGLQCVVLGSGQPEYETALQDLARRYPRQVAVSLAFDDGLAHAIEAGSDFFLMPSRYEPCGLNQMYSLRYGTVPIVRRTGGLADTVRDWDPRSGEGTGFLFGPYDAGAFVTAIRRALAVYRDAAAMLQLRRNGMAEDFSWRRSAAKYLAAYERAHERREAVQRGATGA